MSILTFLVRNLFVLVALIPHAMAASIVDIVGDFKRVSAQGKTTHVLDIDNDSLLFQRVDGLYTSGLRYSQHHVLSEAGTTTTFGWRVGHDMYTASDIKLLPAQISPQDHPYAAWLYGGWFRQIQQLDGSMQKIGVDVGCMGPCAAGEWVQSNLHRVLHQPLPQGWSTQVKNALGVVLYGEVAPIRWMPYSWLDATPSVQGRFGTVFTDASAGLLLRAGHLHVLSDHAALQGFIRIDGRAVAYNAALQGAYFSSQSARTVAPKRWVGEVEAGVLWQHGSYGIKASIVRRSNEIRDLSNAIGAQNFARLQLSYIP